MKFTDRDIEWAERLLLPNGCHFNDERRAFIRCEKSKDVVACPGSGKTTALLAKLLILASRMPFSDGRGVCVLTHTNVAIDQIRNRGEAASEALFRHPNFFGTIQEFANRFLAIPAYVARFGLRHIQMDEDLYEERIRRVFFDCNLQRNGAIYGQLKNQLKGLDWQQQLPQKINFFKNLRFRFDGDLVHYLRGDTGRTFLRGDGNSSSFEDIHSAKYGLLEEGYLRYQDAFPLALWYLQSRPTLSEAFRHRFTFIFVDEAQDTNVDQLAMLNTTFPHSQDNIIQYLGDPNQAIYNFSVRKEVEWTPRPNPLHFSDTMRYGPSIAAILKTVRINDQISLKPNPNRISLPPYLLTFDEGKEPQVLSAFAQLLRTHGLNNLKEEKFPVFKAIGWVGKDKEDKGKLCLRFYLPEYRRAIQARRRHFTNLLSYLHHRGQPAMASVGARMYREAILRGITRALSIAGERHPESNRPFTPNTLLSWLRQDRQSAHQVLLLLLSEWSLRLERREISRIELRDDIAAHIRDEWYDEPTPELETFLTSDDLEFSASEEEVSNIFRDGDIEIEVGTVHSVKGQTHTATLYMDTNYRKVTDSVRLLPFLKGEYPKNERAKAWHIENLKVAHVAMSRPTHLLAFACGKSNIKGDEDGLKQNGWEILDVADIVNCGKEGDIYDIMPFRI